jgi:hypothetical protein
VSAIACLQQLAGRLLLVCQNPSVQNTAVIPKGSRKPIGARLFPILARKAHHAVIFRRGPSRWVQLIKWNTDTDVFESGQWFHGRIYERRCDLSPDGSLLIYFAQKISTRSLKDKEYTSAWTAVSKPPYLTALALWPQRDCFSGGGLFQSDKALVLYHIGEVTAHPNHNPPSWLHITFSDRGRGDDDPLFSDRIERDGWKLKQEWKVEHLGYPKWNRTIQAEIREKLSRNGKFALRLERSIDGLKYAEKFSVMCAEKLMWTPLTRASWADWDQNGRLVFCRDGRVLTSRPEPVGLGVETQLADFNSAKPEPLPPPRAATIW